MQKTTNSEIKTEEAPPPAVVRKAQAFLMIDEVAAVLRCSERTVHRLVDAGRIPPPFRFGGLARWHAAIFEAWLASGCPSCRPRRR